ncbi:Proline-rich protein 12 [Rhodotorula mucilaginosa]|uniref:Proline-rich protein 12 n=1 Tax=Rhodotorula mucilaginosa TaxID=5537 RepID=A0A9P7B3K8_RHOMI|nr:Proline-rich protein 12 [Rhodotorula mucilaginosa]TKA55757.1 hypothetical protein B0A53_02893 [Rhodotorula sp. CCFEE 5036]
MSGKNSQTRPTSTATANGGGGSSSSLGSSQKRRNYNEGGNDDAWSSSVAGPSSQAVNDLAAAIGPQTTDKSCRTCRVRKVKCDRRWPQCQRCRDRGDTCDFGSFVPVAAIPTGTLQSAVGAVQSPTEPDPGSAQRVEALQQRIAQLEADLARLRTNTAAAENPSISQTNRASIEATLSVPSTRSRGPPHEASSASSLTERVARTFRFAVGLEGPTADPQQKITVETFLRDFATQHPEVYLPASASVSYGSGAQYDVTESSAEWTLARAFFSSCCAYLPIFLPWHERKQWLLNNLDNLDPSSRVAAAVFCALGARASPHSAILGIALPTPSPTDCFNEASAAGYRRQQACRSLSAQALELGYTLNIASDVSMQNLDSLMAVTQMLVFDELIPRRSRTAVMTALGQYKDLRAAGYFDPRHDTLEHINLPLLAADAVSAAYARKDPVISVHDIEEYFPRSPLPNPNLHSLHGDLRACLDEHVDSAGAATHVGIWRASLVLLAWVTAGQRAFAAVSVQRASGPPATLTQDIRAIWSLLDEAHEGIRSLQEMLIHLDRVPLGCAKDGCTDQHLRLVTRLDKDLLDLFFLTHSLVSEHLGRDSLVGETARVMYLESDNRIRKALKLTAFYAELYITSRDPHMTYHVFWQLEIFPTWTEIAVQQFGESGGPADPALALSTTELDWLERGLVTASFYHPCAVPRLHELRQGRARRGRPTPSAYPGSTSSLALSQERTQDYYAPPPPVPPPANNQNPSLFAHAPPTGIPPNSISRPPTLGAFVGSAPPPRPPPPPPGMYSHANGGGSGRNTGEGLADDGVSERRRTSDSDGRRTASSHGHGHAQPLGSGSMMNASAWNHRHWEAVEDAPQSTRTG